MSTIPVFPVDNKDYYAADLSRVFGGFIQHGPDGQPQTGILGGAVDLVKAVSSAWQVRVRPFVYVARSNDGVRFSGLATPANISINDGSELNSGESRIDIVCWDPVQETVQVVEGVPDDTPQPPSAGALVELAAVKVAYGDSQVVANRVSVTAGSAWLVSQQSKTTAGYTGVYSVGPGAVQRVPISFPPGMFTEVPNVQVSLAADARDCTVAFENVTATGFTLLLGSMSLRRRSLKASWRAEQLNS